VKKYKMYI